MDFKLKISPSKLALIDACPLYWQDQAEGKSEAAEEGDLLHKAVETRDLSILEDLEQKESAKQCLLYIDSLAPNPTPKDGVLRRSLTSYDVVLREVGLDSDIGKRGRADGLIFPASDRKLAILYDTKFGKEPVEHAATNPQGQDYAYRVFREYPEIDRVQVHFIMPRQNDVTTHEFSRDPDFLTLRARILDIHKRYNDPFKLPTPNLEKACKYCDLKARCPALGQSMVQISRKFNLLPLPQEFAPDKPRTPEERGLAQDLADLVIKWGEAVKEQNTAAVLGGEIAEGYKVTQRRGKTSVANTLEFVKFICEQFDLSIDEVVEKAGSVSFSDVLNLLKDYSPDLDVADIRKRLERDAGHLIKVAPQITFLSRERKGKRKEVDEDEVATRESSQKLLDETTKAQPTGE